jgi:predicted MFS family arabinose efflux permease
MGESERCRLPVPPLLRTNPGFRSFWGGQTISLFGDQITLLVIPLLAVVELDASPAQVGLLAAATLAPNLLFSIHIGAWADRRYRRKVLMVAADLGRASLLLTVPLAAALGVLSLAQLYVVSFVLGSLTVVFNVVYYVVFVGLVPRSDYIEANALLNGSRAASLVGGNGLAGLLVQILTAPLALLADAISYLGSAFLVNRAPVSEARVEGRSEDRGVTAGARFIARSPLMRASLLASATFNLFNAAFYALLVLYATRSLGVSAGGLGLALALGAFGSVLGTVLVDRISRRLGLGNALVVAFVLAPAPLVLVPFAAGAPLDPLILLAAADFLSGIGVMILDVGLGSLFAALVPDRIRARVSGAYTLVNYGVRPLGALGGGLLASVVGLQATMWVATVGAIGGVLWLLPSPMPRLRTLPGSANEL